MYIFFLSKVLPHLLMPLGIALILMIVQIFKKNKWPLFYAISILWSFSTFIISNSLVRIIEHPWERVNIEERVKAEGIVVLSGGGIKELPDTDKNIEWIDPDRYINGLTLFKAGNAKRLFFTGGYNPLNASKRSEGELYIEQIKKSGIEMDFISTTPPVFNTQQEAIELNKIFETDNDLFSKKIILVTSAFHMQRAKKIFEREGFTVIPFPVDFKSRGSLNINSIRNPYNWIPNSNNLNQSSIAIRELIGRIYYQIWK